MQRLALCAAGAALLLAVAGCTPGGSGSANAQGASMDPSSPVVSAMNLEFDRSEIAAPAGRGFILVFDNREGIPHNVAIYSDESASHALFVGDIFGGPARRSYEVPALPAGTYYFRCDLHPDMDGHLVAGGAAAG